MKVLQYKEGQESLLNIPMDFILSTDCGKYHTKLLMKLAALGPKAKDNALGFSANQLRVNAHCFLVNIGNRHRLWTFFANCEIIDRGDQFQATEECLSLPGKTFNVIRYNIIVATYFDKYGCDGEQTFTGIPAQIIQHEVDHCNGILINQHDKGVAL
tara:strand:- start:144 stop:614 length:471 start_codon:yes stop_codon:yes gene_type:complete